VKQAGQLDSLGISTAACFPGTIDGMLSNRKEAADMTSPPALERKRVGYVFNSNVFGFDLKGIKVNPAVGLDVFFGFFHE
jgi:hypothetical protein